MDQWDHYFNCFCFSIYSSFDFHSSCLWDKLAFCCHIPEVHLIFSMHSWSFFHGRAMVYCEMWLNLLSFIMILKLLDYCSIKDKRWILAVIWAKRSLCYFILSWRLLAEYSFCVQSFVCWLLLKILCFGIILQILIVNAIHWLIGRAMKPRNLEVQDDYP